MYISLGRLGISFTEVSYIREARQLRTETPTTVAAQ